MAKHIIINFYCEKLKDRQKDDILYQTKILFQLNFKRQEGKFYKFGHRWLIKEKKVAAEFFLGRIPYLTDGQI